MDHSDPLFETPKTVALVDTRRTAATITTEYVHLFSYSVPTVDTIEAIRFNNHNP